MIAKACLVSFRNMGAPNVYDRVYQERINRVNTDDVNDPINNPVQPFIDGNDPQFGTRAYIICDSLNVGSLSNFELNKTWRRQPYRYGGILEPMIGFKYSTFNDLGLQPRVFSIFGADYDTGWRHDRYPIGNLGIPRNANP